MHSTGLILSLPLTPNGLCTDASDDNDFVKASQSNKITYTVPINGYYFFVFNSENEVQDNYIRVKFDIQKTVYNVSNSIESCNNATGECRLTLNFFSNQKVVFELPINSNESLWNEEFIVISECEPRTIIYLICVISVPMLILLFAFQWWRVRGETKKHIKSDVSNNCQIGSCKWKNNIHKIRCKRLNSHWLTMHCFQMKSVNSKLKKFIARFYLYTQKM